MGNTIKCSSKRFSYNHANETSFHKNNRNYKYEVRIFEISSPTRPSVNPTKTIRKIHTCSRTKTAKCAQKRTKFRTF